MKKGFWTMKRSTWLVLAVAGVAAGLFWVSDVLAGPKQTVGHAWPTDRQVSIDQVDHSAWDALLQKYVDNDGYVNYRAWHASRADRKALTNYLASLSQANVRVQAKREAQLAYWINAYNAVTVEGILRVYPTDSIRKHTAKVVGYNIWKDLLLITGGGQYSLEQIEHSILRKAGEPRVHFAIVCASVGCPRLMNRAYLAETLDSQLTANTRHFFSDRSKFQFDAQANRIAMSPILKWFATDFGRDTAAQLKTIAPYLPDPAAQSLALSGKASVSYLGYDWSLNDQSRKRAGSGRR